LVATVLKHQKFVGALGRLISYVGTPNEEEVLLVPARHFTPKQRREILKRLAPYGGEAITVAMQSQPKEVQVFGSEVLSLLECAGWKVTRAPDVSSEMSGSGVCYGPDETPLRPPLLALVESFTGAGIVMNKSFDSEKAGDCIKIVIRPAVSEEPPEWISPYRVNNTVFRKTEPPQRMRKRRLELLLLWLGFIAAGGGILSMIYSNRILAAKVDGLSHRLRIAEQSLIDSTKKTEPPRTPEVFPPNKTDSDKEKQVQSAKKKRRRGR
jgi:hypothetical protein